MTTHSLQRMFAALKRQVRLQQAVRGLCLTLVAGLVAALALAAVDFLFRFQDRGLRVMLSLAVLAAVVWAAKRFLFHPLQALPRETELALRLERRFPVLRNRLAATIDFLHCAEDDLLAGSPVLRRMLIEQTAATARNTDFNAILDWQRTLQAFLLLAAMCLVVAFPLVFAPETARTALARLFSPFRDMPWPQRTHLAVRTPVERLARGQDFQLEIYDSGGVRLPAEVRIYYRFPEADGRVVEEAERLPAGGESLLVRRENVARSFFYRLEGGDDCSMSWRQVEVVEPPIITALEIKLTPPAYTGLPTGLSERNIRALVGTKVYFHGRADRPLAAVDFHLDDGRYFARLSSDGREFFIGDDPQPVVVEKTTTYQLELTDRAGIKSRETNRWEIVAVPDNAPSVVIEQPKGTLYVTPQAVAPLRLLLKDDLAVAEAALVFHIGEETERSLPIYTGPKQPPSITHLPSDRGGEQRRIEYRWALSPWNFEPGQRVSYFITVADYRPRTGRCEPQQLSIITAAELGERLADREKLISAELGRAVKMQQECRRQAEVVLAHIAASPIEQGDMNRLQTVEYAQRESMRLLAGRGEGLPAHLSAILFDLEVNQLRATELWQRMNELQAELEQLAREQLPAVMHRLTKAQKAARIALEKPQNGGAAQKQVYNALAEAVESQTKIIAVLEAWLARLSGSVQADHFQREFGRLLRKQEEVGKKTVTIGQSTLGRQLRNLPPEKISALHEAADAQLDVARDLDNLLQEAEQSRSATVAATLSEVQHLVLSAQMRSAAEKIRTNQIGQAVAEQEQILAEMRRLLEKMPAAQDTNIHRLVETLTAIRHEQEEALSECRRLEQALRKGEEPGRQEAAEIRQLLQTQQALAEKTGHLAGQFSVASVQLALNEAGEQMSAAAKEITQNRLGPPAQQAQQSALRYLQLVSESLVAWEGAAGQPPFESPSDVQAGRQPGRENHGHSPAELKLLLLMQQEINRRTEELYQQAAGGMSEELIGRHKALAAEQGRLASTVREAEETADLIREMHDVQARLDRNDSGDATRKIQQDMVARLEQLVAEALQQSGRRSSETTAAQSGQPDQSQPATPDQPGAKPSAEAGQASAQTTESSVERSKAIQAARERLWGELPPQVRQGISLSPKEDYPPKYEAQIECYFRSLAKRLSGVESKGNDAK